MKQEDIQAVGQLLEGLRQLGEIKPPETATLQVQVSYAVTHPEVAAVPATESTPEIPATPEWTEPFSYRFHLPAAAGGPALEALKTSIASALAEHGVEVA